MADKKTRARGQKSVLPRKAGKRSGRASKKPKVQTSVEYNLLLTATLILLAFGAVMVFSASSTTRILQDGGLSDSAFYLKKTLIVAVIGLVLMHIVARRKLTFIHDKTPLFMGLTLAGLAGVLLLGTAVNGTKGWFIAGPVQIQPAEFLKLALVLYGAYFFANRPDRLHSVREMRPYLLFTAAAAALVMLQPDMGTMMIALFAVGITLFVAGARPRDLGLLAGGIASLGLVMALAAPYRRDRLLTFLNPDADVTGSGFQVIQAKIAIGSGGFDGVGIGNGVQKAFYLPEAHTDMISAVIGEEFGLIGFGLLILVFGLFGYAGFQIARKAKDDYGRILAAGLTGLVLVQACLNLYAVMGMAPLTGIPLPLVSYGNNSLVVTLVAVGLILNVARGGRIEAVRRPLPKVPSRDGRQLAKLRLVEDERDRTHRPPIKRQARSAQSRYSGGRDGGSRSAGRSRSRRASR